MGHHTDDAQDIADNAYAFLRATDQPSLTGGLVVRSSDAAVHRSFAPYDRAGDVHVETQLLEHLFT